MLCIKGQRCLALIVWLLGVCCIWFTSCTARCKDFGCQGRCYGITQPFQYFGALSTRSMRADSRAGRDNFDLMIRFFRGQYLVVTYAYLLGLNMVGWAKARIDYVHEHLLPMGTVTPSHVFNTAGPLTVLFGALMFLFLVLSAFIESVGLLVFFAFVKWLLLAVFLFNPLDVLNSQRSALQFR